LDGTWVSVLNPTNNAKSRMGFCLEHVIKIQNFFSKRSIAVPIKSCHYASKHEHNKIFTKQCIVDIEFFEIGLE